MQKDKNDIKLIHVKPHDFNIKPNFENDLDDYYNNQTHERQIDESKILCSL